MAAGVNSCNGESALPEHLHGHGYNMPPLRGSKTLLTLKFFILHLSPIEAFSENQRNLSISWLLRPLYSIFLIATSAPGVLFRRRVSCRTHLAFGINSGSGCTHWRPAWHLSGQLSGKDQREFTDRGVGAARLPS